MKKINSIGYAHRIIGLAVLFLIAIPSLLYLSNSHLHLPVLALLIKWSLGIGGIIIIFLTVLLTIEFRQDKRMNKYFEDNKNVRIPLRNGLYECQACGNMQVKREHRSCTVCGINFKDQGVQGRG